MVQSKVFASLILALGIFVFVPRALADMAPNPPDCTKIDPTTKQPGCGYMDVSVKLDISAYNDRFVFFVPSSVGGDESGNGSTPNYILTTPKDIYENYAGAGDGRSALNFIALDRKYFESQGGMDGLFRKVKVSDGSDSEEAEVPKDLAVLNLHAYHLIVSKNDKYLSINPEDLVEGSYTAFYGVAKSFYETTPNLGCVDNPCSKTIIYTPQAVIGNYIVVAQSNVVYKPSNASAQAPYINAQQEQQASSSEPKAVKENGKPSAPNLVVPSSGKVDPAVASSKYGPWALGVGAGFVVAGFLIWYFGKRR